MSDDSTLLLLPHCRNVEILHIPKTGGISLILSLAARKTNHSGVPVLAPTTDFCYTETACCLHPPCPGGGIWSPHRAATLPCGCSACDAALSSRHSEFIGIHERQFGLATKMNSQTLYIAIVRQPESWLRSAISQECNDQSVAWRTQQVCASGNFLGWYSSNVSKYYFTSPNLQSTMLGGIWSAANLLVCTLEKRVVAQRLLEARLGSDMPHVHTNAAASKRWHVPSSFSYATYAHLYEEDDALYRHVANGTVPPPPVPLAPSARPSAHAYEALPLGGRLHGRSGCVWRLSLPQWRAHESVLVLNS